MRILVYLKRLCLINKRLLKKASFIFILCAVPLLVLAVSIVSRGDSGIISIALAARGSDQVSDEIIRGLTENSGAMRFEVFETADKAAEAVRSGKADAAWIFPENTYESIKRYSKDANVNSGFISIIEREDTVPLRLAREKLYGAVYPYISYEVYSDFLLGGSQALSGDIRVYYDNVSAIDELFDFEYTDQAQEQSGNYITAPLRGLLAILIVLCSAAAVMYYTTDSGRGMYVWLSRGESELIRFGYAAAAAADAAVIAVISNMISGSALPLAREAAAAALLCIAAALFSVILMRVFRSIFVMGAALPFIIIGMIVICPVFINIEQLGLIRLLFPPYYYLNAVYSDRYIIYMALYIAVLTAINISCLTARRLFERR